MSSRESRAPLLDRLVDLEPWIPREPRPSRTLDRRGLRESIRRELERLFNSRCPLPAERLAGRPRTVLEYGIPDFAGLTPRRFEDRVRLAELLREAVEAYEPRLRRVRVEVAAVAGDDEALACRVEGETVVDGVAEPVSFPTLFSAGGAGVELAGVEIEDPGDG